MDLEKLNQWLMLLANLGVIAGLVFVALEVRTNTEANLISVYQGSSDNWMQINRDLMSREVAELLDKAFSDQQLSAVEERQFSGWVKQQLTHAASLRRIHKAELLADEAFAQELEDGIRRYRKSRRFRAQIEADVGDQRFRSLILDEDGIDWLVAED